MTSNYGRDRSASVPNDEYERLAPAGRDIINNAAAFFEGVVDTEDTPVPSSSERVALKRAMARFLIDSGIASSRGWV